MKDRKTFVVLSFLVALAILLASPLRTQAAGLSRMLQRGDSGSDVRQVQVDLQNLGYDLKADGVFGPITEARVRSFQGDHGLTVDGIVGPQTHGALSVALGRSDRAATATSQVSRDGNTVQTPDGPYTYRGVLNVKATAYDATWESNGNWGPVAAWKGLALSPGMIAVDPRIIPLGSKVFVTGYSDPNLPPGGFVGIAADTGGAIKGNRIDIYMEASPREVSNFGVQNAQVYVLN